MNRKSRILAGALALVAIGAALTGCGDRSSSNEVRKKEQGQVAKQQAQYDKAQPIPFFDWSTEKDTLTQLYKLRNEARITYTVVTSQGTGAVLWQCDSRGYPIPADTQLTNPSQMVGRGDSGTAVIEQAEPNGLYSSNNTDATWVACVRANGDIVPVYTEQKATAFPFPVTVDANGVIRDAGGKTEAKIDINTSSPTP